MPAKWSADKDQMFLFLLLEHLDVPTNVLNAISGAWPKDRDDLPTPSALRQHINRVKLNARLANPINLNEYPPGAIESAPQAAVTRKRGLKKVKTGNASEDDVKPLVAPVVGNKGKRKRAIDGVAKMSKLSVYELPEPKIKVESEDDDNIPEAKKVQILAVNVEGGGMHEFNDHKIKVESEDDIVITDVKKVKTSQVQVEEGGAKFEAPYGIVFHDMTSNVKVEDAGEY